MNIVNRTSITVTFKKPFIDWNNNLTPDLPVSENMIGESSTYLIPEDFNDAEKLLKKHFKKIFKNELFMMWEDENDWPVNRSFKVFNEWFSVEISSFVYDIGKQNLKKGTFEF